MIFAIARFEFSRRMRLLSTWIYFLVFFGLGLLYFSAMAGAFEHINVSMLLGGKIYANSPFVIAMIISSFDHFALLLMAIMGQAIYNDFHTNSYALFFTAPITKFQYLAGRFAGAFLTMVFIMSSAGLACLVGSVMPFIDKSTVGPATAATYLMPYLTLSFPNIFVMGSLFFTLAALTRKMAPVYAGIVVMFIGLTISNSLVQNVDNKFIASMFDPFGGIAVHHVTEYWSVAEKNVRLIPFEGHLLANRLAWMGVGLVALAFTYFRFRFEHGGESGRAPRDAQNSGVEPAFTMPAARPIVLPNPIKLIPVLTSMYFLETVKNVFFGVIVLAGVLLTFVTSANLGSIYGTNTYPVTYEVLELIRGNFGLLSLILITLFSGELVWRERDAGVDQICDAMPIPSWLPFVSKFLTLMLIQALLAAVLMGCGLLIQLFKGYFNFELGLYLKELFGLEMFGFALISVVALTVQTLVNQKYVGHFVMVLYYIATAFLHEFGFEHHLWIFGSAPQYQYSDMNGYGHLLTPVFWFQLFWACCAVLMAIAIHLAWVRGVDTHYRKRWAIVRERFSHRMKQLTVGVSLACLGVGGFICYNTNVLNTFKSSWQAECDAADYEKKYKNLDGIAQPRIVATTVRFEIYPDSRRLEVHGTYRLLNKTAEPISAVYIHLPIEFQVRTLALGSVQAPTTVDTTVGLRTYQLPAPMKPGDELPLEFDFAYEPHGFKNDGSGTDVVYNGTFFNSELLPHFGYQREYELGVDSIRKKHGLKPREHMPAPEDLRARSNTYVSNDSDWIDLSVIVGTSKDQIAIAPGYLQREWEENGRRCFEYKTTNKILNFFSVQSARYEVKRDNWNDIPLEIFYHKSHDYNLDAMFKGIKMSLEYCSTHFSNYQHKQLRILEFPRYSSFAQSYPNTIPYSEGVGFIARVDPNNPKDIDYPFYITAHEVSHQWWAHQVIGGNVQGCTMLSETLAQYTALMIMKKEFGPERMKRFLKYELDRYLISRGMERLSEMPLSRNENQMYIHYNKGSLVMYALQDYIGEENVDRALSNFVRKTAYQEPPYTASIELLAEFRKVTPPELQYLIEDMFEKITLFDNHAVSATYKKTADDKYEVHLKIEARKFRADENGTETEIPINDLIDIGILDEKDAPIYLKKEWIKQTNAEFTIIVDKLPAKAGIDPINILIDRRPDDNVMRVKLEE
jgi:ABC-2 type transport system permease protein